MIRISNGFIESLLLICWSDTGCFSLYRYLARNIQCHLFRFVQI